MKKIVVTGPECSGKSSLSSQLASRINGVLVPEVARCILTLTKNDYHYEDLISIARYQIWLEQAALACDKEWMVCDTSMLVLKVWANYRFKQVPDFVNENFLRMEVFTWLLCRPLPQWEDDGLRVNKQDREHLFHLYQTELEQTGKPYLVVPPLKTEERIRWVLEQQSELEKC